MARISVYVLACTISYVTGAISSLPPPASVPPPRVTPPFTQTSHVQAVRAYPMNIKLHIVNAQEFKRSIPVQAIMAAQQMSGVGGYTLLRTDPCEIVIPDDFEIEAIASKGEAWFTSDTGETLAHEILHCLYGSWHQPWNKIASQSKTASSKGDVSPLWTKKGISGSTKLPLPMTPQTWSTR